MCRFIWFCTHEIDSTPPATATGTRSTITRCAAIAMVCRPEEQKRLTVTAAVVAGQPARIAIWRAMFWPVAPSGNAQPIITSSTSAGATPARSIAWRTACPPSFAPCVMLKAPRQDLASGVRAVDTMTASGMGGAAAKGTERFYNRPRLTAQRSRGNLPRLPFALAPEPIMLRGLMMDMPLLVSSLIEHAGLYHADTEI